MTSSDPTPGTPAELLAHAAWLRQLAHSLVRDAQLADDLVQDTWLAALRRPPSTDRPVRPWLRRVIVNAARLRWRGEAHRGEREAATGAQRDSEAPSAAVLLERHETQLQLARLVGELEEPFRTTILLRFSEGLSPSEIARRLGVPAGTVRSRLSEGLERLRVRLDGLHRGDRRAWMALLTPLARPGAGSLGSMWAVAAAVAVLAIVGVVVAVGAGSDRERVVGAVPMQREATDGRGIPLGSSSGVLASRGPLARRIAGRVVREGVPVEGARVRLTSDSVRMGLEPGLEQRTAADGRFAFVVEGARQLEIGATVSGALAAIEHVDLRDPVAVPAPETLELALRPCVAALHGRVTDATGAPIPHAQLLREDVIGTETDAMGAYELCMLPVASASEQLRLVVRADGYGAVMLDAGLPGRVRRDFVLTPEAIVTGVARMADGRPVSGAKIVIERDDVGERRETEQTARNLGVTDAAGRFRIAGVGGGRQRISGEGERLIATPISVAVAAAGTREVEVVMQPTGVLRGRVEKAGAPVAGVLISVAGDGPSRITARSQADGGFVLEPVPAGEVSLVAWPFRVRSPERVVVTTRGPDPEVVVEVEALGAVNGVVHRHAALVPFARVCAGIPPARNTCTRADAAGRYSLEGLQPGAYVLFSDDAQVGAFVRDVEFSLAEAERRTLDIDLVSGARIAGTVVDPMGAPVADVHVRFTCLATGDVGRCVTDARGEFACGAMAGGGAYVAAVYASEDASVPFRFSGVASAPISLDDRDARVEGVHLAIVAARVTLQGTVVDATGAPVADARLRAWGDQLTAPEWLVSAPATATDQDGHFAISGLAPGTYALEIRTASGFRTVRHEVVAGAPPRELVVDPAQCAGSGGEQVTAIRARPAGPVIWDHRLQLVGWDVPERVRRGHSFSVALHYQVLAPLDRDFRIFIHLDGEHVRAANGDHEPVDGRCPTTTWRAGQHVVDRFTITIPESAAAGAYALWTGLFTGWAPRWINLPISDAPAAIRDSFDRIALGTVVVE